MASNKRHLAGVRYYNFKRHEEVRVEQIDHRERTGERNAEEKAQNCTFTKDGERVWTF